MTKLLGIISLILMLVLFPPAALAVVSNNAVPGDVTYPIKRSLEDVVYTIASVNPITKAWFAAARSDRRFAEITTLIAQGKQADRTMVELVEQTQVAANQIKQVSDPVQKEKMISQLSQSIAKYDAGLAQASQTKQQKTETVDQQPVVTLTPVLNPSPTPQSASPTPKTNASPEVTSTPQPSTAIPSPTSSSTPSPTSPPTAGGDDNIDRTREQLEKIKEQLEKQKESQQGKADEASQEKGQGKQEKKGKQKEENKSHNRKEKFDR